MKFTKIILLMDLKGSWKQILEKKPIQSVIIEKAIDLLIKLSKKSETL